MNIKLKVQNISKRFGNLIAVNNVSFDVYEGEIFTLLGPSGCGKTTTLRIITGLEKPDTGRVYIGDRDVTDLPPQERNVCLVFQEYAVFPHMSVFDNIAFGLKIKRYPMNEIRKRIYELAEMLELTKYLNYKAGKLGLSEQQRIALARCIAIEPEVLLLDEPLTLVDAKVKERMRRELKKLQREFKKTMIYVTHDQLEAMMLSDRIAVMNKGRLLQVGTPSEIYDNPKNLFVALFIGSPTMNTLDGKLVYEEGRYILAKENISIDLTKLMVHYRDIHKYVNRDIVIGFRPEDVYIDKDGILEGVIDLVEVSGDKLTVHVKVSKDVSIKVFAPIYTQLKIGDKVRLSFNIEKVHIFDKVTEERIYVSW